jgi:LPS-assembly protein
MYRPAPGKVINVGYRDLKPDPYQTGLEQIYRVEQTDISFRWPVRADLSIVGKWNYAIEQDRSLDLFAGFEFNSCCWGLRMVGRRFLSNIDGEFESGVFLQFELKGLAGIGEKTVDFLTRSIPGYESEF